MCQEKYFVYTLRLLAGKCGAICTEFSLTTFWIKILTASNAKIIAPLSPISLTLKKNQNSLDFPLAYIFRLHFFVEVPQEKVSWQAKERPIRNIYLKNCDKLLKSTYFFSKTCHALPWRFSRVKILKIRRFSNVTQEIDW